SRVDQLLHVRFIGGREDVGRRSLLDLLHERRRPAEAQLDFETRVGTLELARGGLKRRGERRGREHVDGARDGTGRRWIHVLALGGRLGRGRKGDGQDPPDRDLTSQRHTHEAQPAPQEGSVAKTTKCSTSPPVRRVANARGSSVTCSPRRYTRPESSVIARNG